VSLSENTNDIMEVAEDLPAGKILKYGRIALSVYNNRRDATELCKVVSDACETEGPEIALQVFANICHELSIQGEFIAENPELFSISTSLHKFMEPTAKLLDKAGANVKLNEFIAVHKYFKAYFMSMKSVFYVHQELDKKYMYKRGIPKFREFQQQLEAYITSIKIE